MDFEKLLVLSIAYVLTVAPCFADEALAEYRRDLEYCAGTYMIQMDDHVSPANVIAQALVTVCRQRTRAKFETIAPIHSKYFWDGYFRGATKLFTAYVLQHRASAIR